jgi:hypothetical protein
MTLEIHPDTRRKLERLPQMLADEFPALAPETVRLELEAVTHRMVATARIEEFVPVLVHRFARESLLELSQSVEVASQPGSTPEGPG